MATPQTTRPDLDRTLDSSGFATAADSFVAAYYLADELERGALLGPLHLSRFDRSTHRWQHATGLDEDTEIDSLVDAVLHRR